MLKRFEVENYKGFADRLVWDFSAGDYAFNRNLVHNGLVNSALVYGINGSGKTSLGLALFDITLHLTDKSRISGIDLQNYTNLYHPGKHVSFSYTFLFENAVVRYEYQKSGPDSLIYEKLTINNELWLDYDDSDTGTKFIHPDLKVNQNINQIDSRLSILKYIYRNTPANRIPLLTEMFRFCKNMFWYRGLSEGNPYAGFENGNASLEEAICQSGKVNEFEGFLHDHGIDHRLQFETVNGEHRLFACFPTDDQSRTMQKVSFAAIASSGTLALLLFFFCKIVAFNSISFLFIDDFDAYFHFDLSERIIHILNNESSFQSVVTTHRTSLMHNSLTRPDCCYILTGTRIANLNHATNRELREAHNLEKLYISGEFNDIE